MKTCKKCDISKPEEDFYKQKSCKDGLQNCCKACTNKLNNENNKAKRLLNKKPPKHPGKPGSRIYNKSQRLLSTYGLTIKDKFEMFKAQYGKCAICKRSSLFLGKELCVDHNHTTGEVRGLLCGECNKGLGLFRENIESLINAINYIKFYNKIQ